MAMLLSGLINTHAFAAINSATLTAATLNAFPHCLHYKIKGVCYWMHPVVGVTTTPYVEHYLPDVVISVFNKPDDNPWTEINLSLDKAGKAAQQQIISSLSGFDAGSGQHSLSDEHEQNVFFKEVDVIGNPALAVLPNKFVLLPSAAKPFMPYYQSMLDSAAWRGLLPTAHAEEAYAMVANIPHHIGTGFLDWGGIYPHEGKITTTNDAKAAAVIAQRAGDLISSRDFAHLTGHIFYSLPSQCGQACSAVPVRENDAKTQFQTIYPLENTACDYFGKTIHYGEEAEMKTKGAYVWVVWRFYSGCQNGMGKFVGKRIL